MVCFEELGIIVFKDEHDIEVIEVIESIFYGDIIIETCLKCGETVESMGGF